MSNIDNAIKKSGKIAEDQTESNYFIMAKSSNSKYQVALGELQWGRPCQVCLMNINNKILWIKQLESPEWCHVSDDGKVIVADGLWDLQKGRIYIFSKKGDLLLEKEFDSNIIACDVSPNGRYVVIGTGYPESKICLVNLERERIDWYKRPLGKIALIQNIEFISEDQIKTYLPEGGFYIFSLKGNLIEVSRNLWSESRVSAELYNVFKAALGTQSSLGLRDVITEAATESGRADIVITTDKGVFLVIEVKSPQVKRWDLHSPSILNQALQYARDLDSPFYALCNGKFMSLFISNSEYTYPIAFYVVNFNKQFAEEVLKFLIQFQTHPSPGSLTTKDLDYGWTKIVVNTLRLFSSYGDAEKNIELMMKLDPKKRKMFLELVYEGFRLSQKSKTISKKEKETLLRRSLELLDKALEIASTISSTVHLDYAIRGEKASVLEALGKKGEALSIRKEMDRELFKKARERSIRFYGLSDIEIEGITLYYQGIRLIKEEPERAFNCLERALELNPYYQGWPPYWSYRASALLRKGKLREALHCFNKRIELQEGINVPKFVLLGKVECLEGLCAKSLRVEYLNELIETYKIILKRYPKNKEIAQKLRYASLLYCEIKKEKRSPNFQGECIKMREQTGSTETKLFLAFDSDVIVEKGLHLNLTAYKIPRYIEEYLALRECDQLSPSECSERVSNLLMQYRPDPSEKDLILSKLMRRGEMFIMDLFKVTTDIKRETHRLEIPCIGLKKAMISPKILSAHENLLRNGVWGIGKLVYDSNKTFGDKKSDPVTLTEFIPYQLDQLDLKAFQEAREYFSDLEWIDLLIQSIGLNPAAYTPDQKLLFLTRLIPLVEANVNVMEFGPRATGKTFLYKNISPKVRVIAGGRASPAQLFYNKLTKSVGLIGIMDVVVFDEVQYLVFSNVEEMVGKMKDYMSSGNYERGEKQVASDCSLVFMGNADIIPKTGRDVDTFLPSFARDPAFMDRIHGLIPGWRLPKIKRVDLHLAKGKGLALDYLGAMLHELRKVNASGIALDMLQFPETVNIRDQQSIVRLISGMFKVLYPDLNVRKNLTVRILNLMVEMRRYVKQWLAWKLPQEYGPDLEVKLRAGV
ncbi:TPA: BREX system Lon protease-like protein BrxL [Candidatus Bathyarchaeota archaeon]|nr:BREX system Lon protease-like protein BrxL [Candidatus Bathyarchaeota archaeon]